jgi:hypothetical protein
VAHRLCARDDKHYSVDSKAVKLLRDAFMVKVNSGQHAEPDKTTVADFYSDTFMPWAEQNLKPSSVHGYKKLWAGLLEDHFKGKRLGEYKTHHGSPWPTSTATGRMTLFSTTLARSLPSGIAGATARFMRLPSSTWGSNRDRTKSKTSTGTAESTLR